MIPPLHVWCLALTLDFVGIGGDILLDEPLRNLWAIVFALTAFPALWWIIREVKYASQTQIETELRTLRSDRRAAARWTQAAMQAPRGIALYLRIYAITLVVVVLGLGVSAYIKFPPHRLALLIGDAVLSLWALRRIATWLHYAHRAQCIERSGI